MNFFGEGKNKEFNPNALAAKGNMLILLQKQKPGRNGFAQIVEKCSSKKMEKLV